MNAADVEDCIKDTLVIGGENYYITLGDAFVMCTVPRENDPAMSNIRMAVETAFAKVTEMMERKRDEAAVLTHHQ